jgi:ABC-type dipeptide/oligopeptide/nickel transport system permease component
MKNLHISSTSIESQIAEEYLRQAKWSFNLAVTATIISFSIGVVGAGLLLSGRVSEGAVTTAGGLISTWRYQQLVKQANKRLIELSQQH